MENFKFKKKYGQNFLKDINLVKKIAATANIDNDSLTIEVGPGQGILTKEILKLSSHVIAYEIDEELKSSLEENLSDFSNLEIIFGDFLKRDIEKDIEKYEYSSLYFVSNVPYYITTPILMKLINSKLNFKKIVMMVQDEVGSRFCAMPATKNYGAITVILNYYYHAKQEFKVNRKLFTPVPNVDSCVISFTPRMNKLFVKDEKLFFQLVRDAFQYKRKNIRNNLKSYDLETIQKVLEKYEFNLMSRAEQIPVEVFVEISNAISLEMV